jgi:class 3 adenylate cyclase
MIGDVRGLEEFTVSQPLAANIFAFRYLLIYFVLVAIIGITVVAMQRHQTWLIARVNGELSRTNEFLESVAQKLAKYLSPQHYRSIFSGEKDVVISTERKKLTIFFSDVVNFTATTERMQPEELTALLNEYLTEMSEIAIRYGGSVNKFIGDAMLVFFGDPTTQGVIEDAHACIGMAFEMQRRLAELNVKWRKQGIEQPFRARMGINTGYCNVGNFGSEERMDYTIIGAEANLAARLQSIAQPGEIVLSYETFILVSDMVRGRALEPFTLKGISRSIVPYVAEAAESNQKLEQPVITEHSPGIDLFLDVRAVSSTSSERIARVLEAALALVRNTGRPAAAPIDLQATEAAGEA